MEQNNKSFLKWAFVGILVLVFIIVGVVIFLRNHQSNNNNNTETEISTNSTVDKNAVDNTTDDSIANDSTTNNLNTSSDSILDESEQKAAALFKKYEKQAYAKAKTWKDNATLCAASVKISNDLSTQGITYSYIYCTPDDKTFYYNINFNSTGDFLRALIWQTDYIKANLPAISLQYFKISFAKALQIAETNGGQSFRNNNPQSDITLNLYKAKPNNYNYWFVQYQDRETPEKLIKQIDANSGEIVGVNTNSNSTTTGDDSTSNSNL